MFSPSLCAAFIQGHHPSSYKANSFLCPQFFYATSHLQSYNARSLPLLANSTTIFMIVALLNFVDCIFLWPGCTKLFTVIIVLPVFIMQEYSLYTLLHPFHCRLPIFALPPTFTWTLSRRKYQDILKIYLICQLWNVYLFLYREFRHIGNFWH